MRQITFSLITIMVLALGASAQLNPTTTLAAETGKNTSTQLTGTLSNGNIAGANVSKVNTRELLYSGSTTKIYAHLMPWFGTASHYNVNYSSTDPNQVNRQVEDMISRGIQGVIIDWYGPGTREDEATKVLRDAAQRHPGFEFAIMVDQGALRLGGMQGGNPTQTLINQINYAADTYFKSPNYMRFNGRPIVTNFDIDLNYGIDWNAVAANVKGNPIFIFQHDNGFSHAQSGGSYGWIPISGDPNNWGSAYLNSFYGVGQQFPGKLTFAATWKGFNDGIAAWSKGRVVNQDCGRTWLRTFDELNKYWNSSRQLPALQIVTWNDYEEGTPIETGIDNCVSVSASMSGSTLNWSIKGDEYTIHHYTVFASTDGQNLAPVADVPAGTHSLSLDGKLPQGSYSLYVKAVGKPSLTNKMSGAVKYTSQGGTYGGYNGDAGNGNGNSANLKLKGPDAVRVGSSATLAITADKGKVGKLALSCSAPSGLDCSLSPSTVDVSSGSAKTTIALRRESASNEKRGANPFNSFMLLPAMGMVFVPMSRRRKIAGLLMMGALLGVLFMTGCGGGSTQSGSSQGSNVVTITATSGSVTATTTAIVQE